MALLETLLSRHETNGVRHTGRLWNIEKRIMDLPNLRKGAIEQIRGGSKGLAAFDSSFYDVRDTFKEDALMCYSKHLRPKDGCPDYKSDSKMLLPDTAADRREAGLPKPRRGTAPVQYLCQYCPIHTVVQTKRSS